MKILSKIIPVLYVLFTLSACDEPKITRSGLTVKIGVIAPLSGNQARRGKIGLKGIEIAKQFKSYLDNGDQIVFIVIDDHSDKAKTVTALDNLVNSEQVSAVLLLSGSDSAIAIAKVADKYKTPILATVATNPEITENNQFVSQLAFNDATQALVAALYVRDELFIKKVAIFNNPNSAYSSYLANEFAQKFKQLGGQVTNFINLEQEGPNDFQKLIAEVELKEPELLYLPVNASSVLAVANELETYSWAPLAMVTDGMLSTVIEEHEGDLDLIDGMLATDLYSSNMKLSRYGKDIFKHLTESEIDVTTHILTGIEGYGLLVNAINQCEAPYSGTCINDHIRSRSGFTGLSGRITIDKNGKADHTLFINTIKNGEMKIRVKVN